MTIAPKQIFKLRGIIPSLSWLVLLVFFLSIVFDRWHAHQFQYSFYWTESMLYGFKWLLFIPGYAVLNKINQVRVGDFKLNILLAMTSSVLHLLALGYCIMTINYLLGGQPFQHLFANLMADNGLFFLLIYLGLVSLPSAHRTDFLIPQEGESRFRATVVAQRGANNYFLEVAKISLIKFEHGCCIIYLDDASRVSINSPMIDLETQLDPQLFCRIHRNAIVKVSEVLQSTSRGNGDYDLTLRNGKECRLSRRYRQAFRAVQAAENPSV
jgi:hypothetical protein